MDDLDIHNGDHDCRNHIDTADEGTFEVLDGETVARTIECPECGRTVKSVYHLTNYQVESRASESPTWLTPDGDYDAVGWKQF